MEISVLDDGDFFVSLDEDYYVFHTADEVLHMLRNNTDIKLDIEKLNHELKKLCLKHGLRFK